MITVSRDASLKRHHPWIFSGGISRVDGDPQPGDLVRVENERGQFLAWAAYSPASQIRAKVWSFDENDHVDEAFVVRRMARAIERRPPRDACRWVFAESDEMPGVIIDRYADVAVVEITGVAGERWRQTIVDALMSRPDIAGVVERLDAKIRNKEGLPRLEPVITGHVSERIEFTTDLRYEVDVRSGHKTGTYLDQHDNRQAVRALAAGRRVLDVCCFAGGFAAAALAAGAVSTVGIDSSGAALRAAVEHTERNGFIGAEWIKADAFEELRRQHEARRRFDMVILDPPKLANGERDLNRATRAYKDLNLHALGLIEPGGYLITFSCSGAVSDDLFQKVVFGAALDAGRPVRIEQLLHQSSDHPVLLTFPEAAYLKGLVCRVE